MENKGIIALVAAILEAGGMFYRNASGALSLAHVADGRFLGYCEEHMNAWINITEVTDNYPDLRGEMHDIFDIIENGPDSTAFKFLLTEIWTTWEQVEQAMNLE